MRVERKEIQKTVMEKVYIASDGKEFYSRRECQYYEQKLGYKGIKVCETAVDDLNDFDGEHEGVLYNIENENDWKVLVERVWFDNQIPEKYPGPGHYLAFYCDGGDSDGHYVIENAEEYLSTLRHNLNEYESLIYNEIANFNT